MSYSDFVLQMYNEGKIIELAVAQLCIMLFLFFCFYTIIKRGEDKEKLINTGGKE